jgi:hypothetical protein
MPEESIIIGQDHYLLCFSQCIKITSSVATSVVYTVNVLSVNKAVTAQVNSCFQHRVCPRAVCCPSWSRTPAGGLEPLLCFVQPRFLEQRLRADTGLVSPLLSLLLKVYVEFLMWPSSGLIVAVWLTKCLVSWYTDISITAPTDPASPEGWGDLRAKLIATEE